MKLSRVLPFTILFATTTVFGQSLVRASSATGCPIGLQVDHGPSFVERKVNGVAQAPLEQRIRLTMTNLHLKTIVSAQVTAHGLSEKARVLDVSTPVADRVKTIQFALEVKGNGQTSSDLSLPRFAAVTAVDLNEITYADGSSWREPSPGACSVAPSFLMPVGVTR